MRSNKYQHNQRGNRNRSNLYLKGEDKVNNKEWLELLKRTIIRQRGIQQQRPNVIAYYENDIVWPEFDALVRTHLYDTDAVNRHLWNSTDLEIKGKSIDEIINRINTIRKKVAIKHPDFLSLKEPDGTYTMVRATTNAFNLYWHYVQNYPDEYSDILDTIGETGRAY